MGHPPFQFLHDHEGVDAPFMLVTHQGIGNLVLDIAGRNSFHPFLFSFPAKFEDIVFGETGEGLPIVEFQLLHQRQLRLLRFLQAGQDRPHGRRLDRVGGNMNMGDLFGIEIFFIDFNFIVETGNVGYVDLDRPVPECLHEFVVLKLLVFRCVRMSDDDFVNVGLGKFLRFDLMLLRRTQKIIKESDIQFEDLDKLDQSSIGHVEFAVEIEGSGV